MADEPLELFTIEEVPRVAAALQKEPGRIRDPLVAARQFGGYTVDKLTVFEWYLKPYRRVAGSGTYIDGFAGGGEAEIDGRLHPGSPRVAIDAKAFRHLHFFEESDAIRARLEHHLAYTYPKTVQRRYRIHDGDFNDRILEFLAEGRIERTRPCFAFLDPDSTQLNWSTVEALARYKTYDPGASPLRCKVELWILFNLNQAIQRLWTKRTTKEELPRNAHVLDSVMGGRTAWRDLWDAGAGSRALVPRYAERLRDELGYRFVMPQPIRDPATRRIAYWMVHASDHPAAVAFMHWAHQRSSAIVHHKTPLPGLS